MVVEIVEEGRVVAGAAAGTDGLVVAQTVEALHSQDWYSLCPMLCIEREVCS